MNILHLLLVSQKERWAWAEGQEEVRVEEEGALKEERLWGSWGRRIQHEPSLPKVSWCCLRGGWRAALGEDARKNRPSGYAFSDSADGSLEGQKY